jgi:hypothetical protein
MAGFYQTAPTGEHGCAAGVTAALGIAPPVVDIGQRAADGILGPGRALTGSWTAHRQRARAEVCRTAGRSGRAVLWHARPVTDSAWPEIRAAVAAASYPTTALPVDEARARRCLSALGITTRSWLGAVTRYTGGLLVDHGWLRVNGGGTDVLPDVTAGADADTGTLVVAHDVLGGRFSWMPARPGEPPTVHYFGPDVLDWQDLGVGYAHWLGAALAGSLTRFYQNLRWPGWEQEVSALRPDHGIHTWPPPWSEEGQDLSAASRKTVPIGELIDFHRDTAAQLGEP